MARDEGKDSIDRLKGRLYARNNTTDKGEERSALEKEESDTPLSWKEDLEEGEEQKPIERPLLTPMTKKKGMSLASKFFIGSILFFILATAVAAYMFFGGGNIISPQNIDIQIVTPSLVDGGKEADMQILIQNHNQSDLQLVDLVINYPDGTRSVTDPTQALTHERQTIGTINSGQQVKRTASALFFGSEGSQETLNVTLEYSLAGSNAIFEKDAQATFTIGSSPISLSITMPSDVTAGQSFSSDIEVRSNATTPVSNVVVQAQYPFGYSFASSNPSAEAGGTIWRLGTMAPGSTQTIHVTGSIDGQDGDQRVFRFLAGSNSDQTDAQVDVPLLTVPQTLTVHRPFITASIAVNGTTGKTIPVASGNNIQGTVTWQNNLTVPVSDVQLSLSLVGPSLDPASVHAQTGFFQSTNSTIIWTKDQDPSLASIPPGGTGTEQFTFSALPTGSNGVLITNPTIALNLTVQGTGQGGNTASQSVSSAASATVQLGSSLSLSAQTQHYSGAFSNSGPMPPRAEQATTYTILWTVQNSANTIANAVVTTTLPPYVQFVAAQNGSGITYDAPSRTVTWSLGDVKAGVGYTLPGRQGSFEVSLTPSSTQVGSSPQLTSTSMLSGQDRFAQVSVAASANANTTLISGESGFQSGMDIVGAK